MTSTQQITAKVVTEYDIERSRLGGIEDLFFLDGSMTEQRVAVVEHRIAPGTLAAPMHRHSREDEFSFVIAGRVGAISDGVELEAGPGQMLIKPRAAWHTFWNAGDEEVRLLEVISPAGLEELFKSFASGEPSPEQLITMAADFGCEVDFPATMEVAERLGLEM